MKDLEPYTARLTEGLERVNKLLLTASHLTNPPSLAAGQMDELTREAAQDILRAAVVLMHAYLEDFLRTIALALLPSGDENCLSDIPLAGVPGRQEKFPLGKLVYHRGKSVDEVLRQSVPEYLDRSNFNSTGEIALLLEKLGFDVDKHNHEFPLINQMIQRRHCIVHRADRVKTVDSEGHVLQPILAVDVLIWMEAATAFMGSLMGPFLVKKNPLQELAERLNLKLVEE